MSAVFYYLVSPSPQDSTTLFPLPSSSPSSSLFKISAPTTEVAKPRKKSLCCSFGVDVDRSCVTKRGVPLVRAANIDESLPDDDEEDALSDSSDEETLPPHSHHLLDAKLQQKLEHKMKLKLSRKVRLRSKKLMRKRRMNKRGKWPPSKLQSL